MCVDTSTEERPIGFFEKNQNLGNYDLEQSFSDLKSARYWGQMQISSGAKVMMMVSKAKAPSWLPPLPGCERSANMEYAEWALVVGKEVGTGGQMWACSDLKIASWRGWLGQPWDEHYYWEVNEDLISQSPSSRCETLPVSFFLCCDDESVLHLTQV